MSSASLTSPPSPAMHRDIRGESQPFKRSKDHSSKWIEGRRPLAGVRYVPPNPSASGYTAKWTEDTQSVDVKMRPRKQWSQINPYYKTHANKTPRESMTTKTWENGMAANRVSRKLEAQIEAKSNSDISRSLLELVPHHVPNASTGIQTAVFASGDEGVLYPFEYIEASPSKKGRAVGFGGLIEKAEEKFLDKQTEQMVKEDYEVLDTEGESIVLKADKKRKGSPKQKAAKTEMKLVEEDDGFELI